MGDVMLKIYVVKAKNGCFIRFGEDESWNIGGYGKYLVNGEPTVQAHVKGWYRTADYPYRVSVVRKQPNTNYRYVLNEHATGKDELPKEMPRSEVMTETSDGCVWKEEFKHLHSLYELVSDEQPDAEVDEEFEAILLMEIDRELNDTCFSYPSYRTEWRHEGEKNIDRSYIKHRLTDKLIYPDIVHSELPCALTEKESFDIIRKHILENINPKSAKVTIDYDFCLDVVKVINLQKVVHKKVEEKTATGKSYRNRRYRDVFIKNREVSVYRTSPEGWTGYPEVSPFRGNDHEDLKRNIDIFLEELMENINTPLVDCPHCNGMGVVLNESP